MSTITYKPSLDVTQDELTGSTRTIDEVRHMIHMGRVFVATETLHAASAQTLDIVLRTTSNPDLTPHMLMQQVLAEKRGVIVKVYVSPTLTDTGTPEVSFNLNLQSDRVSQNQVFRNPTITDPGQLIAERLIPHDYSPVDDVAAESVLAPSTDYLLRIEIPTPQIVRVALQWFEQQVDYDKIENH